MKLKLFITDFDGTLLRSDQTISVRDLQTLEELRSAGVTTAIATGRSVYSFARALESIHMKRLPVDYYIFSTGAGIMTHDMQTILFRQNLSSLQVRQTVQKLQQRHIDCMVLGQFPDTQHCRWNATEKQNPDFYRRLELYKGFTSRFQDTKELEGPATEVLCIIPKDRAADCEGYIRETMPQLSVIRATSPLDNQSAWIEIFHPQVSKSRATRWLSNHLQIPRNQVAAVGNDYNDEDLLEWAEKGFVTSEAPTTMIDRYPSAGSNDDNAVTRAAGMCRSGV